MPARLSCLLLCGSLLAACLETTGDRPAFDCDGPERCNGEDDDCDGLVDEGFDVSQPCTAGEGICARSGNLICAEGGFGAVCNARPDLSAQRSEVCNGMDDDCDGVLDEGAVEACNARDDDCDGLIDEGYDVGMACTAGRGRCIGDGRLQCRADGEGTRCDAREEIEDAAAEVCNGVDDDCNGVVDDGPDEACNGVDDDCDGRTDEGPGAELCAAVAQARVACQQAQCVIAGCVGAVDLDGRYDNGCEYVCTATPDRLDICVAGVPRGRCQNCDGADNDCDGEIDEVTTAPRPAMPVSGVCAVLDQVCDGDRWRDPDAADLRALPDYEDGPERSCDGLDNDCDGTVDEGLDCDAGCDHIDSDGDGTSGNGCAFVTCGEPDGAVGPPCNGCPSGTRVPRGWVCVPAGLFTMGSDPQEVGRDPDEGPVRDVAITRDFLMRATEVTQQEWLDVWEDQRFNGGQAERQPSVYGGGDRRNPVENITWFGAVALANAWLAAEGVDDFEVCHALRGCVDVPGDGLTCNPVGPVNPACLGVRLPTEAEWEYAARAGATGPYGRRADGRVDLEPMGLCLRNPIAPPGPVADLLPNAWGLYDMHGNVSEWVFDGYAADYDAAAPVDPVGPVGAERRVHRGGSYAAPADDCRSAARDRQRPTARLDSIGIRLVRTLPPPAL